MAKYTNQKIMKKKNYPLITHWILMKYGRVYSVNYVIWVTAYMI